MDNYLANDHHELLLENLLPSYKVLNISLSKKSRNKQKNKLETRISKTPK